METLDSNISFIVVSQCKDLQNDLSDNVNWVSEFAIERKLL